MPPGRTVSIKFDELAHSQAYRAHIEIDSASLTPYSLLRNAKVRHTSRRLKSITPRALRRCSNVYESVRIGPHRF